MIECNIDLETRSPVPIKNGTWVYAAQATILLIAYRIGEGQVQVWDRASGEIIPEDLHAALTNPDVVLWAHNAAFDRTVMLFCDDPVIRQAAEAIYRWRCSMAQAYAHGLPGALEKLGDVLRIDTDKRKLKTGKDLMRLFCIPPPKNSTRGWATPDSHPKEWEEFRRYAGQDIVVMCEARRLMPKWNYKDKELALWHLDQIINARGVCVDVELAEGAVRATEKEQAVLAARTQEMTEGEVQAATQRDALLKYLLASHGVDLPDMQASTLERRIDDPSLPDGVRELLAIRLQASSTSVAKYRKLLAGMNADGRLRGTLQFCGAARTGRWAGRLVQLQNLPRPTMNQSQIELGIKALKTDCADLIFDNVMQLCASAVRGFIVAPPGRKLVVCDLANIEGRVAAWLAGEDWKLQAFRDYDTILGYDEKGEPIRKGPDMYRLAYARAFAIDHTEVTKSMRQIGKVMELMLQYQGGVGAFLTGAATYGIDLDQMAEAAWPTLPEDVIEESADFMRWLYEKAEAKAQKKAAQVDFADAGDLLTPEEIRVEYAKIEEELEAAKLKVRHGLSERTFIVCDSLKRLWRRAHPAISSFWKELEDKAKQAIATPGVTFTCRRLKFRRDGAWLRLGLPSGRVMCFPDPEVDKDGKITYMGIGQYSRAWERISTYGGKLLEGPSQAVARDQLAHPMPEIEAQGYAIGTHMHDELVTETPDDPKFNADHLGALMCADLGWNAGLPLAAAGFETDDRYRKD